MSATGAADGPGGDAPEAERAEAGAAGDGRGEADEPEDGLTDLAYFHAIELAFILQRGAPLLLSPADYQVIKGWHRDGMPLELVLRELEEYFDRRRLREDARQVRSLRQCRPKIDAAWRSLKELTAPGARAAGAEPLEVEPRLAALARALPEHFPGREALAEEIAALAALADPRRIEERLAELEERAVDDLLAGLRSEEAKALEAQVDQTLAGLAGRVPSDETGRARQRLLRQRARRRAGLPTLSLFAPEAEAAPEA
jgi:hypothetical protein